VPNRHLAHYERAMKAIRNHERIDPTSLVQERFSAATPSPTELPDAIAEATATATTTPATETAATTTVSPPKNEVQYPNLPIIGYT